MNERDLYFLAKCAVDDVNGAPYETVPEFGEAASAERLRKRGFLARDMTRKIKPFKYVLTVRGTQMVARFVRVLEMHR